MIVLWFFLFAELKTTISDIDMPDVHTAHHEEVKGKMGSDVYAVMFMKVIKLYQQSFSLVQGDVCNFIPSCSHFGYDALKTYGFIKGLLLTSDRLQRCHPGAWKYLGVYYLIKSDSVRGERLYDPVEKYR